ncbi:hypothetical protein K488DRAFT_91084 [Vararia minispora EC-137]|uniref:Uncharacterized protein n=1 Tax=Vararia minispora EC-137 TaxID=1314806 RepID=A0ACB8Q6X6_9AGAM|nr:hypothetical protein K488DRAFT_91084 [Vararia minispora EC-137]
MSTICMVAARYQADLSVYEDTLRSHAESELGNALASGEIVYVLQAHVLLGSHALTCGDFLVAPLSLSLHFAALDPVLLDDALPEPLDQIEEGERVNAFWTVYSLKTIWGVALNTIVGYDREYNNRGWIESSLQENDALRYSLFGAIAHGWSQGGTSSLAEISKASALIERALFLSKTEELNLHTILMIDSFIDNLALALGPTALASPHEYAAHLLLRGATFVLHCADEPDERALHAARAMAVASFTLLPATSREVPGFLEPAVGIVIPAACRVLMSARSSEMMNMAEAEVDGAMNALLALLEAWALVSTFVGVLYVSSPPNLN